ncbi:carbohydrate ABC transporter permease [Chelativorans sp.]|uniref:carbohydrate ABC transporter permease n=1 Tax=Chelativorans sp. TaxID=2203393 RepID=UPI0035C66248
MVGAFVLVPLVITVLGGFKALGELRVNPFGLPETWRWEVYWEILRGSRYWQMLGNSLVIALATVFLTVAFSAMAAFVFAQLRFFGSEFLLAYLTLGLMFPAATAVLPLFIKVRDLGLLNTHWAVILPQAAFGLAMSILLCRNFFKGLPAELKDAAFVDGCSYFGFFWHVVLPLSRPILATTGVIAFVHSWNAFLLPLVMLNSPELYPWPLGIMVYQGEYSTEWNRILAYITLTMLPATILFLLAQRYVVAGLTTGAVKG